MLFLLVIYGLKHNPWPSGSDPCAIVHGPLASLASAESPPQLQRHLYTTTGTPELFAGVKALHLGAVPAFFVCARVLRLCPQATRCEPLAGELGAVKVAFVFR